MIPRLNACMRVIMSERYNTLGQNHGLANTAARALRMTGEIVVEASSFRQKKGNRKNDKYATKTLRCVLRGICRG